VDNTRPGAYEIPSWAIALIVAKRKKEETYGNDRTPDSGPSRLG
jgi:hypothetical protein